MTFLSVFAVLKLNHVFLERIFLERHTEGNLVDFDAEGKVEEVSRINPLKLFRTSQFLLNVITICRGGNTLK